MLADFATVSLEDINRLAKQYLGAEGATAVRVVSTGKAAGEEKKGE